MRVYKNNPSGEKEAHEEYKRLIAISKDDSKTAKEKETALSAAEKIKDRYVSSPHIRIDVISFDETQYNEENERYERKGHLLYCRQVPKLTAKEINLLTDALNSKLSKKPKARFNSEKAKKGDLFLLFGEIDYIKAKRKLKKTWLFSFYKAPGEWTGEQIEFLFKTTKS